MKKLFFSALISFQVIIAQTQSSLKSQIEYLILEELPISSQVAIDVYDLTEKETLYRINHKLLFRPASNMKLFTTAAALVFLGKDYQVKTNVYLSGSQQDSVWNGNIVIKGACDPLFTDDHLDTLISQIKYRGIKKIDGNLIGDVSYLDSLYWGSGWMWDDNPYPFQPYLMPLILNESIIGIEYKPGIVGEPIEVKLIPELNSYFSIKNNSSTVSEDSSTIKITRDWINNSNDIFISGKLNINSKIDTVKRNIIKPADFFLNLFLQKLEKARIEITGDIKIGKLGKENIPIATVETNLTDIVQKANKESDNLSAEMLLRLLGGEHYGIPSSASKGIKLIDSLIVSLPMDPKTYRFADGSGLSFYNLVSAELITELLKYLYLEKQDIFEVYFDSLPVAGIDGTLEKRMTNSKAEKNVSAKTGTLSGVSCLSGFVRTEENKLLAFSIMNQNYVGSSKVMRDFQDKLCEILVRVK